MTQTCQSFGCCRSRTHKSCSTMPFGTCNLTVRSLPRTESGAGGLQSLRLEGRGQLNGRAASFEITGDPLAAASHKRPYHFAFDERSSGSRLTGRGSLARPFDFDLLDTTFDAAGTDLKDIYFLTGV